MNDILLTKEQVLLKNTVKRFAEDKIRPTSIEYDKKAKGCDRIPKDEINSALKELDINSAFIPSQFGGSGYGLKEQVIIMEELARGDLGFALTVMNHSHTIPSILVHGTQQQKEKWLPVIAGKRSNGVLTAAAVTEPDTGSAQFSENPSFGIQTSAKRVGDHYIINGKKCFINNAGLAELYLVWARTDFSQSAADGGTSVFIVPSTAEGLNVGHTENFMGVRTSCQGELFFDDCKVPAENLLGGEGLGYQTLLDTVPGTMTLMGAASVGLARAAFELTRDYCSKRKIENKPLKSFQAISHKLIDMSIMIESVNALVWRSACMIDRIGVEFKNPLMCKITGSEMAEKVTSEALLICGAYGYSSSNLIEKFSRDAYALSANGPNLTLKNTLGLFI